jgi:hypothetical protein
MTSVVLFALLLSAAAAGLSFVGGRFQTGESAEQAVAENRAGHIVQVRSYSCSKIDFDNRSGHFGDRESVRCPDRRHVTREYQLPTNRIERFSKGFFK